MDYSLIEKIKMVSDYSEIEKIIDCCKEQRMYIIDKEWENTYKEKCPTHYLPLRKFVEAIDLENYLSQPNYENIKDWVYRDPGNASILYILGELKYRELSIPKSVSEMVCESCACCGCSMQKEHLGFDCEECKTKMTYTGYEGYCDE